MKIIVSDKFIKNSEIMIKFYDQQELVFKIQTDPLDHLLKNSDFITLHVPAQKNHVIGKKEFSMIKNGSAIINASRGGVIDELALLDALNSGKISFAGLDTFEDEPTPKIKILMHPNISLTPHIGAATNEAQDRIGIELADKISEILG